MNSKDKKQEKVKSSKPRGLSKDTEQRREEILQVAEEYFLTYGYEKTKISHIVKKIGVAQGTFYYHYESKDAVLLAIITRKLDIISKTLYGRVFEMDDPVRMIEQLIISCFQPTIHKKQSEYLRTFLSAEFHQIISRRWFNSIEPIFEFVTSKLIDRDLVQLEHPRKILWLLTIGTSFTLKDLFYQPNVSDEEVREQLAAIEELLNNALKLKDDQLDIVSNFDKINKETEL